MVNWGTAITPKVSQLPGEYQNTLIHTDIMQKTKVINAKIDEQHFFGKTSIEIISKIQERKKSIGIDS